MQESIYKDSLMAGGKIYFFDVRETKTGDRYLQITESRREAEGFRRTSISIFKEYFDGFSQILEKMKKKMD